MLYRLKHLIFGWDYIAWENSCSNGIARVEKDGNGNVWYWRYRITRVRIRKPEQVIWLTCPPSKYFN
jgi:hypothetical protein